MHEAALEIERLTAERDEARGVARQFAPQYARDYLARWPWLAGELDTPT